MADQNQLEILRQGVEVWNKWRYSHQEVKIDLSEANLVDAHLSKATLYGADLSKADMSYANLREANLYGADLWGASLNQADLSYANLSKVDLSYANLREADMRGGKLYGSSLKEADLGEANLSKADLSEANLEGANLQSTILVKVNLHQAILTGCKIFGISAWGLKGVPKDQSSLVITPYREAEITVDDLQVAQFVYLLLNNKNVRNVIDTITSKAVLILGRFTDERKSVLDALYKELRRKDYLPILFDFSKPTNRDMTETISTLAHLARFIIADITDAKSIPQELQAIVPNIPSVPVKPMLLSSQQEYAMFEHIKRYPWVLPTYYYQDNSEVISSLSEHILWPLEAKARELTGK